MKRFFFRKTVHESAKIHGEKSEGEIVCKKCKKKMSAEELESNFYLCPSCNYHFRMPPFSRIRMLADKGEFREYFSEIGSRNPLDFPGYEEKMNEYKRKSGLEEAVVTGSLKIGGYETAIFVMAPNFMMGSMGSAVGEKITKLILLACDMNLPLVGFTASGGARMQEGIFSLYQMSKTASALSVLEEKRLPFFVVLTDPTTGGVTASFAMLGDIILAEPEALIGFAGPRVIEGTINQKLPDGFQRSEFQLEKGFVDLVVERRDLKNTLIFLLKTHNPYIGVSV